MDHIEVTGHHDDGSRRGAAPPTSRRRRHWWALAAAGVATLVSIGGTAEAAKKQASPDVLLHFTANTTFDKGGRTSTETWQTPDGSLWRDITVNHGHSRSQAAFDRAAGTFEFYVPSSNRIFVETKRNYPDRFKGQDGAGTVVDGNDAHVGDLAALLRKAASGSDPDLRYVGRTTVRGVDVDQIEATHHEQVSDVPFSVPGRQPSSRTARAHGLKTVAIVRDLYIRHDNALPVRLVLQPGPLGSAVTDYDDVEQLPLDASTRKLTKLHPKPGARRIIEPPFDDSKAGTGADGA